MKFKLTFSAFLLIAVSSFTSCSSQDEVSAQSNQNSALTKKEAVAALAGDCSSVPGWASQNGSTTGGASSAETVVSTYAELKSALENNTVKVVKITGTITITTRLSLQDGLS